MTEGQSQQRTNPPRSTSKTNATDDALPAHKSNKPSDEDVAELNAESDDLLDEIDRVLEEAAASRAAIKATLADDLLDEIDAVLVEDLAGHFRQAGGE